MAEVLSGCAVRATIQEERADFEDAVAKIRADLEWRGPSGRPMNFVVMSRKQGQVLYQVLEKNGLTHSVAATAKSDG